MFDADATTALNLLKLDSDARDRERKEMKYMSSVFTIDHFFVLCYIEFIVIFCN